MAEQVIGQDTDEICKKCYCIPYRNEIVSNISTSGIYNIEAITKNIKDGAECYCITSNLIKLPDDIGAKHYSTTQVTYTTDSTHSCGNNSNGFHNINAVKKNIEDEVVCYCVTLNKVTRPIEEYALPDNNEIDLKLYAYLNDNGNG